MLLLRLEQSLDEKIGVIRDESEGAIQDETWEERRTLHWRRVQWQAECQQGEQREMEDCGISIARIIAFPPELNSQSQRSAQL
jgi:hypothetical protein